VLISSAFRPVLQIAGFAAFFSSSVLADVPATMTLAHSFGGRKVGDIRDDNCAKMKLVWCPPGEFMMGSGSDTDQRYNEGRVPVKLTHGFWLGRCEVTQAEWKRVMHSTPWAGKDGVKQGDYFPASCVSWDDAMVFCGKLTSVERAAGRLPKGWRYTLPTDAQWEYACRAGTTTSFHFGAGQSQLPDYAWFGSQCHDKHYPGNTTNERYAHSIGLKKPNEWGLYDMYGNVWEWCLDVYSDEVPGGSDPLVSRVGSLRVFRGGSWKLNGRYCRSAFRNGTEAGNATDCLGFRLAASPNGKVR
jgi:formylglycine-generating enzyme required for sulfatase activity